MKFTFKWPYQNKLTKGSEVKSGGEPIARVIDIEETEDGIYVTAEFYDPESKEAKIITGFDPAAGMSLGPYSMMQDYAKKDAELTASLYGVVYEDKPVVHFNWYWIAAIIVGLLMWASAAGIWWLVHQ